MGGTIMRKQKLSVFDQVEHMKTQKGIKFNIINEDAAVNFLSNNNYYFKLKAYAKNYDKYLSGNNAGKYLNLEFAYLLELSTLDFHLRHFTVTISLHIEHFLKVRLVSDCVNNPLENGYDIVDTFLRLNPFIKDSILSKARSSVCGGLVTKYIESFAIWNIVEVLPFGDFSKLYDLYYRTYSAKGNMENYLWSVRCLRNAAAHNNCLLNNLKVPYISHFNPNKQLNTAVSKIPGIDITSRKNKLSNPVVHDFVATLLVFDRIVMSEKVREHVYQELNDLVNVRFTRNKHYFESNEIIKSHYRFIRIIVDSLCG